MVNDFWLSWTATSNCTANVVVTDVPNAYDPILVIWEGPDCLNLTEVSCDNDTSGVIDVSFPATNGTTYWFQIGDTGTSPDGDVTTVDLDCTP
jgi:hypothetical protein